MQACLNRPWRPPGSPTGHRHQTRQRPPERRDERPETERDVIARAPGSCQDFFDIRPLPAVNVLGHVARENPEGLDILLPHLVLLPVRRDRSVNVYGRTIVNVHGEGVKVYKRSFLETLSAALSDRGNRGR